HTSASATFTIQDTTPPTIVQCPPDLNHVPTDPGSCFASGIVLTPPVAYDLCGTVTFHSNAPAQFSPGTTTVTWTVQDGCGNTTTCDQHVTVEDTQSPTINVSALAVPQIWPPNLAFVNVGLSYTVNDTCGATTTVQVYSDEADTEPASDNTVVS